MTVEERIMGLAQWGTQIEKGSEELLSAINQAEQQNAWYTPASLERAVASLANQLKEAKLREWLAPYPFQDSRTQSVGLIFAGNIPLVGFHDLIAVLAAGYRAKIKLSSADRALPIYMIRLLTETEPRFGNRIELVDRLSDFDLVIATGSNNSARYFDYYFRNHPHIIRKNRNSVAVLDGQESPGQLNDLGHDIFDYFGLGCRNVSKIYVPSDYDFRHFFEGIQSHEAVKDHFKYNNNYDYNKSIYLINGDKHYDNGFLLLKEDRAIASPLAVVYYEHYESLNEVTTTLNAQADNIQCVVSTSELDILRPLVGPGESQQPSLTDYADGINTLEFLADPKVPVYL